MTCQRANKALHRSAIPMCSIATGEFGRSAHKNDLDITPGMVFIKKLSVSFWKEENNKN